MQGVKALTIMTAMLDLTAMLSNHLSNKFPIRILKNHINETPVLLALSIEKLLFIFFRIKQVNQSCFKIFLVYF